MGLVIKDDGWRMPDWLWERIGPLLPPSPPHPLGCHRPRVPDRDAMDAILLVLRTGMQWNALNATGICSSSSAHRRFQEWERAGVFAGRRRRCRVGGRHLVPRGCADWLRFPPAATLIRACGSPAHGSPTPFAGGIRLAPLARQSRKGLGVTTSRSRLTSPMRFGETKATTVMP